MEFIYFFICRSKTDFVQIVLYCNEALFRELSSVRCLPLHITCQIRIIIAKRDHNDIVQDNFWTIVANGRNFLCL